MEVRWQTAATCREERQVLSCMPRRCDPPARWGATCRKICGFVTRGAVPMATEQRGISLAGHEPDGRPRAVPPVHMAGGAHPGWQATDSRWPLKVTGWHEECVLLETPASAGGCGEHLANGPAEGAEQSLTAGRPKMVPMPAAPGLSLAAFLSRVRQRGFPRPVDSSAASSDTRNLHWTSSRS